MLHACNLLVIGEYHIQKPNQALRSMEQCASIKEPEELLFFGNSWYVALGLHLSHLLQFEQP
jgi:hypothetical protein